MEWPCPNLKKSYCMINEVQLSLWVLETTYHLDWLTDRRLLQLLELLRSQKYSSPWVLTCPRSSPGCICRRRPRWAGPDSAHNEDCRDRALSRTCPQAHSRSKAQSSLQRNIKFLTPTGAQGVTMCIRSFVRSCKELSIFIILTQIVKSTSFELQGVCQSVIQLVIIPSEPIILRLVLFWTIEQVFFALAMPWLILVTTKALPNQITLWPFTGVLSSSSPSPVFLDQVPNPK